MGHRGVRFDNPDYFPVQLMNWILTGGKVYQGYGAFSGRVFFQLRTSRGISSQGFGEFEDPFHYPPAFVVYWNGREEKAGEALSLVFREIDRLRREPVSALELATARNFFLYGLPARFHSAAAAVETLGQLDFDRAPLDLYSRLQKDVGRTTATDVLRVARDHIRPERLLTVILGDVDRILAAAEASGHSIQEFGPLEVVRPPR
jgi:zinc protease